ncbi:hypothetical protein [Salinibaculum rarum]|uniref:hypothetical protein n=1 Tax=Salinibaculum rarum TaxID=3058903 RepID=UPI00265FF959|nr:hypothetical protein [Salinibaculum sp. KK48]
MTTTNVVQGELKRKLQATPSHSIEGTDDHWIRRGCKRALAALDDQSDKVSISVLTVVPRPNGEGAGEESLRRVLDEDSAAFGRVLLNDAWARDRLQRFRGENSYQFKVLPPTYLLYVLYQQNKIGKQAFCEGCETLMRGEGWTSVGAVYEMWRQIPVDCTGFVDDDLFP